MRTLVNHPKIFRLNTPAKASLLRAMPPSFSPKDGSCIGCGGISALRLVSSAINFESTLARWEDRSGEVRYGGLGAMLTEHTGCMQVVLTTQDTSAVMDTMDRNLAYKIVKEFYPDANPSWDEKDFIRSMIHDSFSDATPTLIGTHNAYLGRVKAGTVDRPFYFWSFGGDGAFTIGTGQISSFLQQGRGLLVIYDNRGYANTGYQVSSTSHMFANCATTPLGEKIQGNLITPIDIMKFAMAHEVPFAATASVAYPDDLMDKVRYAINISGPTILWIDAPCPKEQGFAPDKTKEVSDWAVESGYFPLVRYHREHGNESLVIDRLRSLERTNREIPISEWLEEQARSQHILRDDFKLAHEILRTEIENKYAWFLKNAGYEYIPESEQTDMSPRVKLKSGIINPSLYLNDGELPPVRELPEF